MTERRFSDDEVAAIFARAAELQPAETRATRSSDGITLTQLQEIGREVGIAPDAIAHAITALDQQGTARTQRVLGIPIGVSRTVELPRKLTDDEWERLVAILRETFDARGVMRAEGSMRAWVNGNLHVMLEPTASGQRLRMRTIKGSARTAFFFAAAIVAYVTFGLVIGSLQEGASDPRDAIRALSVAGLGLGVIGVWMSRLPAWARTRREQMEEIAARVFASLRGE